MAKKVYTQSAYSLKLKDPRWQKKRLEILERDKWTCQNCDDKDSTLHVHHKKYEKGDPWDIDNKHLITLCFSCHEIESDEVKEVRQSIANFLYTSGWDSYKLLNLLYYIDKIDWNDEFFLGYVLSINEDDKHKLRDSFFDSLNNKNKNNEHGTNS